MYTDCDGKQGRTYHIPGDGDANGIVILRQAGTQGVGQGTPDAPGTKTARADLDTMNKLKALCLAFNLYQRNMCGPIYTHRMLKDHLLYELTSHVLATEHGTHHQDYQPSNPVLWLRSENV